MPGFSEIKKEIQVEVLAMDNHQVYLVQKGKHSHTSIRLPVGSRWS